MKIKNNLLEIIILIIIQPILFIEDKARILFKEIVLGSIIIVKKIFNNKNINKKNKLILIFLKINKGIIFWIEERIIKIYIELVFKIEINQIWKGAIPNFINMLIIINKYKLFI